MRKIKFNTSGYCAEPLVATPRETSWYTGVEGCGVGCRHPLLTQDERVSMRTFVVVVSSIATVTSLFAVVSLSSQAKTLAEKIVPFGCSWTFVFEKWHIL